NPDACLCRTWRAEIELDRDAAAAAATDARAGMACAETEMRARAALAVALVRLGDVDGAREQIQATTSSDPPHPRGELAAALLARSTGDVAAARDAAAKAIASAAYLDPWPKRDPKRAAAFVDHSPYRSVVRDAHMVEAMVAIDQKQYDDARAILAGVLHDAPDDAEAVYDVALIEDLEGHFNPAREGYLRALKLRPSLAAARYNLALLTLRFGVMEEARHHAQAFKRDFPGDPRAADLELRLQSLPQ
ncbi:MAG TPA: tetratricopeptide repeat protein, partial [Polyangiaceae bacterium]|nr:tetratricopeptide repeat protein [Polyangiaceae bacterium]